MGAGFFFEEIEPTALTRNFRRIYFALPQATAELETQDQVSEIKN